MIQGKISLHTAFIGWKNNANREQVNLELKNILKLFSWTLLAMMNNIVVVTRLFSNPWTFYFELWSRCNAASNAGLLWAIQSLLVVVNKMECELIFSIFYLIASMYFLFGCFCFSLNNLIGEAQLLVTQKFLLCPTNKDRNKSFEHKHNKVKNPNLLETNQLAIYKRGQGLHFQCSNHSATLPSLFLNSNVPVCFK